MNLAKVLGVQLDPVEQTISEKDCMLYALGIGFGAEPTNPDHLQYVYEQNLKVFPSQSVVIAHPGPWITRPEFEIDFLRLLHGEQTVTQHQPLRPGTTYIGNYRILGVVDKGSEKGCILYQEKTLTDKATNELVSTVTSSYFMRGDGGCGSTDYVPDPPVSIPDRAPDHEVTIPTADNSALIYRLSGDLNPIHADPHKAGKAGFDRPILHGLCTFGAATRAIVQACGDSDPDRLEFVGLRFSAPVLPGETINVQIWRDDDEVKFTATVLERNVKVLDKGLARVA